MLKQYALLSIAFLWATAVRSQEANGNLSLLYDQPTQGEKIHFTYRPAGTDLENEPNIVAVAYAYEQGKIQAYDVPLKQRQNIWEGTIKPSKEAVGLYLKFQNSYREDSNYKVDRNNGKGYPILLYNKMKHLLPGATLITAAMLQEAQYHLKINWDPKLALILFEQEFEREPALKRPYIAPYVKALREVYKENATPVLGALHWLSAQSYLTEDEMLLLNTTYSELGKVDKADAYYFLMRKHWPRGQVARNERADSYRKENDIAKKVELLRELAEDFPAHDWQEEYVAMAEELARAGDVDGFKTLITTFPKAKNSDVYRSFSNILIERSENLQVAQELVHYTYQYAVAELANPTATKPPLLSEKAWLVQRENTVGLSAASYGKLHLKQGEYAKALPYLAEAFNLTQGRMNSLVIEPYVEALLKTQDYTTSRPLVEAKIAEGERSDVYKGFYKELYVHENGREEGFETFWTASTTASASAKVRERLQKEMLREAAQDFELRDLNGKLVKLSSLKGKTVVVDFWATWCMPCLAAFKTMSEATQYHKGDDVAFLFVNTYETTKDKKKAVKNYKTKHKLPFQMLMDEDDTVAKELYQVTSLPTKLVIDAEGNLRFKKVGQILSPDDEALREMLLMIEMACSE